MQPSRVRRARLAAICGSALALALSPFALAATPASGTATVDGDPSEWTSADVVASLTIDGDGDNDVIGQLSLRYDCATETLYGLFHVTSGDVLVATRGDEHYWHVAGVGKIVTGESGNDGTPPDFALVGSPDAAVGYEASATVAPGEYTVRAHGLIVDDSSDGYAQVDNVGRALPLTLVCAAPAPTDTPVPAPTATPVPAPTETPAPTGTEQPVAPTPTPTGTEQPVAPNPTPTPTGEELPVGGVGGPTGPGMTLPPTDTVADEQRTSSDATPTVLAILGAVIGAAWLARPQTRRPVSRRR